MRRCWEYQTIMIPPAMPLDEGLNEVGADGWELVSILERKAAGIGCLMKREKLLIETDLRGAPAHVGRA